MKDLMPLNPDLKAKLASAEEHYEAIVARRTGSRNLFARQHDH